MSLGRCIPGLLAEGKLTPDQAKRAQELFDGHAAELGEAMSPAAAAALASRRTLDALDFEAVAKRTNMLLQVKAQDFADAWLTRGGEHWGGGDRKGGGGAGGGIVPGEGPVGPVNPKAAKTLIALVDTRRQAIEGEAFGHVAEILRRHRAIVPGKLRNKAELDELGREAFGEDSGSLAAKEAVQAVKDTQEWLRLRANAAGAAIGKLENRGFATHHDSRKVAEAGFDAWWAAERPRWDVARMVDERTGQPFTEASLERAARAVQATIASDGALDRAPGAAGQLSFANRLGQHRFIHYKNFDAWKASQAQFGAGTAFDALVGEVKGMARAIAAMELLGPNPDATVRFVLDRVSGDGALFLPGQLRKRDLAQALSVRADDMWHEYTGALRQPENRTLALAFSSYRAIAASSKLGSAATTALGDIGFGTATRKFNGLPIAGIVGDYIKLFADPEYRLAASYLSFVPEVWTSHVSATHRFLAEELTGEVAQRVADGVLRASGLMAVTDAGRQAHGLVTFIYATMVRDRAYGDLEPAWRAALQRYRIGEKEWDALRGSAIEKLPNGLHLLTPQTMADGEAKARFLEMAHNEQDFAVPVPDLETRTLLDREARKGSVIGELLRSSPLMFRTFTISSMLRHGGRMTQQAGAGKLGYLLAVVVPVTVMGTLIVGLGEVSKGRDPPPLDDPRTWLHGLAKGGGLGISGDVLGVTAEQRYNGLADLLIGPGVQDAQALTQPLFALGKNAAADMGFDAKRDPRAAWKLVRAVRNDIPGQNIWYSRLVTDRLLADQIQRMIDPEADKSFAAMQRRAAEHGQGFYWAPGETAPTRAPNLMNAIEGGTRE